MTDTTDTPIVNRSLCSPGEILLHEFLLYKELFSPEIQERMTDHQELLLEIAADRQRITAEIALVLSGIFGTSAEFWTNLQNSYDESVKMQ